MKTTPTLAVLLLALFAVAATIPKRYLFSTTSIDSMAPSTLGTNVIAQTNAAAVRTLYSITNATGLEATDAHLVGVSNRVVKLETELPGYATNYGAFLTNATRIGGSSQGVTNTGVTASRVVVFDANGVPTNSAVSATTLSYLDPTSSIQTQLNTNAANTLLASNAVNTLSNALPAANLTGSIADARLSSNVALINGTNNFTGTNYLGRTRTKGLTGYINYYVTNGLVLTNIGSINSIYPNPTSWNSASNDTAGFLMPPMDTTTSQIVFSYLARKTDLNNTSQAFCFVVGQTTNTCTNLVAIFNLMSGTAIRAQANFQVVGALSGSYTNLTFVGANIYSTTTNVVSHAVDYSQPWVLGLRAADNIGSATGTNQVTFDALEVGVKNP